MLSTASYFGAGAETGAGQGGKQLQRKLLASLNELSAKANVINILM